MSAFQEIGVMPELARSLEHMGWTLPTEIQSEAIPLILGGGDVLMASETGSGKTGAFCIPIVQVVYEEILAIKTKSTPKPQKAKVETDEDTWKLSFVDRDNDFVLTNDQMARSKSGSWKGCRTNKGVKRSKQQTDKNSHLYFEVFFADQGLARVGWSFSDAKLDLGTDRSGWGYGGTAKKSNNGQFIEYGQTFGEKFDIVGCILDLESGDLSFTKNGRNMGVAFRVPLHLLESKGIYPTICLKNAGCKARFGPVAQKDDYKPKDCIWVSEADKSLVVELARTAQPRSDDDGPLAIILEPSRELAFQTYECIRLFSSHIGVKSTLLVGGESSSKQPDFKVHIVVCTPGKLAEATNRSSKHPMKLNNVHFFILDEADGLLQQGFQGLISSTHSQLPLMFESGRRLQTICCSATLHNFQVKKLANELMYFPVWIDLKGEDSVPDTVHHVVLRVDPKTDKIYSELVGFFDTDGVHEKDDVARALCQHSSSKTLSRPEEFSEAIKLMKFYYTLKAIEKLKMDQGIIFCRTKLDCDNLDLAMNKMNLESESLMYSCVRLHSSLSQRERLQNLNTFKAKQVKFLICTDVAARGIDIKGIPFVIQVTLPDDKANYVHRIGRVGRAERMGLAVSLVANEREKVWYHNCNRSECRNTKLVDQGGCCKWFDELSMLGEIEEHLKCSIQEVERDFELQVDEYNGKVVYGAKRLEQTSTYEGHVDQLRSIVNNLSELEDRAQTNYLKLYM